MANNRVSKDRLSSCHDHEINDQNEGIESNDFSRKYAAAPNPVDEAVGAVLRQLRRSRRVSMAVLARHLGLSYQQIQKYERGDNRMVASVLFRIADFFGIDAGDLFALANANKERATSARFVIVAMLHDAIQHGMPEDELAGLLSSYSKISDENVREGVNQLIERLAAAEPCTARARLNGAQSKQESP